MEAHTILDADILDILFDGKNKEYGAYALRKTYNRRLVKALGVTASVVLLLCGSYFLSGLRGAPKKAMVVVPGIVLEEPGRHEPPPPPPPPPSKPPQQAETRIFTPPRLVVEDVPDEVKPPENDELDKVRIGLANTHGDADPDIVTPPAGEGVARGITEPPKKTEDDNGGFVPVEVEATYPGGLEAWKLFLNRNLHAPEEAIDKGVSGTVVVQFIVDKDGSVSDVQAISGPEVGGLREEAVRVIKKSGKWTPALQNGRYVKAYRRQPITFQLVRE